MFQLFWGHIWAAENFTEIKFCRLFTLTFDLMQKVSKNKEPVLRKYFRNKRCNKSNVCDLDSSDLICAARSLLIHLFNKLTIISMVK